MHVTGQNPGDLFPLVAVGQLAIGMVMCAPTRVTRKEGTPFPRVAALIVGLIASVAAGIAAELLVAAL